MITLLCGVETAATKTIKLETDLQVQAKHLERDTKINMVVTSCKLQVPNVFVVAKAVSVTAPLPAMKKYQDWADSNFGLKVKIKSEIAKGQKAFNRRLLNSKFSTTGRSYLRALRTNSEWQWSAVSTFLEMHHTNMKNEYEVDSEEAWMIIQKILDKLFELGAEVWLAAQDLLGHLNL